MKSIYLVFAFLLISESQAAAGLSDQQKEKIKEQVKDIIDKIGEKVKADANMAFQEFMATEAAILAEAQMKLATNADPKTVIKEAATKTYTNALKIGELFLERFKRSIFEAESVIKLMPNTEKLQEILQQFSSKTTENVNVALTEFLRSGAKIEEEAFSKLIGKVSAQQVFVQATTKLVEVLKELAQKFLEQEMNLVKLLMN